MNKEQFKLRLIDLHANPPPAYDWRKRLRGDFATEDVAAFDEYFSHFAEDGGKCPGCKKDLPKTMLDAFVGAGIGKTQLEWGLQNGEAYCVVCRYPYRGIHRNIGPIQSIELFLAYHPKDLYFDDQRKGLI